MTLIKFNPIGHYLFKSLYFIYPSAKKATDKAKENSDLLYAKTNTFGINKF